MSIRPLFWGVLPSILASGLLFASAAKADGAMWPIRPEERSFLERMDAELARVLSMLPVLPATAANLLELAQGQVTRCCGHSNDQFAEASYGG